MLRKVCGLTLLLLFTACVHSIRTRQAASASAIVGTYEHCLMACSSIELRADGRFEERLYGDLFNDSRARGGWAVDQDGRVVLNGDQQPRIMEGIAPLEAGTRFRIVDQKGAWPEIATVILTCPAATVALAVAEGKVYPQDAETVSSTRLESDDFVHVDDCRPSEFWVEIYSSHRVKYSPKDRASNEFIFVLDTNTDFYVTNEKYLWKPGYLYAAISDETGGGWSEFPLKLKKSGNSTTAQHAAEAGR